MHATTATTTLLLTLGLALATPTKRTTRHPGRQTINNQQYTVSCNLDRPGGDYARQSSSWADCIGLCAADSACVTAQYHEDHGFRYLKNAVNAPALAAGEDTVDLGSACQEDTSVVFDGVTCSVACGVDHHGGDYSSVFTGNYLSCADACARDGGCVTAQYDEGNGYCYLKNADNGAECSGDTDSVVCVRS